MPDPSLEANITAIDHRSGHFTLTCSAISYLIEFRPEMDVMLGDLLRRFRPVLVGGSDPSGQLAPVALLREIGIRLWRALLPDTTPERAPNRGVGCMSYHHRGSPQLFSFSKTTRKDGEPIPAGTIELNVTTARESTQ